MVLYTQTQTFYNCMQLQTELLIKCLNYCFAVLLYLQALKSRIDV